MRVSDAGFVLLAALAALALISGQQHHSQADHIRLISSLPLTGSALVQSATMVNGIRMALEDADYQAGPFKIDYTSLDDATAQAGAWDQGKEQQNARQAVADPDCMVYIGTYNSGAAKIAIPILERHEMVMISPANSYMALTKHVHGALKGEPDCYYPTGLRNFCRVVPADDIQGAAQAQWAKLMGVQRAYVLDDKELYGHGLATVFSDQARQRGIDVVAVEGIDKTASDFRALMSKVKNANVDLVYFGGITQNGATKLVMDMREAGVKAKFMGPDGMKETAFIEGAGPASEGTYVTMGSLPMAQMPPAAQDWYRRYKAEFHAEPEAYAIYSYESASVALAGIRKAGVKNRRAILDAVMHTQDFDGVLGRWSFDANGDTTSKSMSGYQVQHGNFEFVRVLTPD
ncbi:MAG: branched-chain amino acid ABC transporter substrate-binding protein [Candidatus Xenobia bacterium]